jgi:DNA-binding response OmpR family regulator
MTRKVLIIDDDIGMQTIVAVCLQTVAGWQTLSATSGEDGLQQAARDRPDAILLDMTMPTMGGLSTFAQLQQNLLTQSIPTILLTASTSRADHQDFLQQGIAGVITKPFKAQELVAQVRAILNWLD